MQEVKNLGPGGEEVFNCMGLVRSRGAVKCKDTGLHVMVVFSFGRLLQFSGELAASISVNLLHLWQNYWVYLQKLGVI